MINPCIQGSKHDLLWRTLIKHNLSTKDIVYRLGICNHTKAISNLRKYARRQGGDIVAIKSKKNPHWFSYRMEG
jgi:hypothetical protein